MSNLVKQVLIAFMACGVAFLVHEGLYLLNQTYTFSEYKGQPFWGKLQSNITLAVSFSLTYLIGMGLFLHKENDPELKRNATH